MSRIALRPIGDADAEFLYRVYRDSRAEEMRLTGWGEAQVEAFLRDQFRLQHASYQASNPTADFDVIEADGVPVGRLYVERLAAEIRVIDIALLAEHRRAGIGGGLMRGLVAEAEGRGAAMSLYVEFNNPIRDFYARLGFEPRDTHGVYIFMVRPAAAAVPR